MNTFNLTSSSYSIDGSAFEAYLRILIVYRSFYSGSFTDPRTTSQRKERNNKAKRTYEFVFVAHVLCPTLVCSHTLAHPFAFTMAIRIARIPLK